jgi:hypothetical protein
LRLEVGALGQGAHDHQVVQVVLQTFQYPRLVGDGQPRFHLGIVAQEYPEQMRHEVFGGGDRGQVQRAFHPGLHADHVFVQHAQPFQHIAAGLEQFAPGLSQEQALAHLLDQRHAHAFLQPLDLDRDRRLGQVKLFRHAGIAQVRAQTAEQSKLMQGDVAQSHSLTPVNQNHFNN